VAGSLHPTDSAAPSQLVCPCAVDFLGTQVLRRLGSHFVERGQAQLAPPVIGGVPIVDRIGLDTVDAATPLRALELGESFVRSNAVIDVRVVGLSGTATRVGS
jgi:hypothetical protein